MHAFFSLLLTSLSQALFHWRLATRDLDADFSLGRVTSSRQLPHPLTLAIRRRASHRRGSPSQNRTESRSERANDALHRATVCSVLRALGSAVAAAVAVVVAADACSPFHVPSILSLALASTPSLYLFCLSLPTLMLLLF